MKRNYPKRRLEDRIRELSGKLAAAENGVFESTLAELQAALTEHALRVHNRTSAAVLAWPAFPQDRRHA